MAAAARDRQAELTKPPGSLGRLEELAVFMAAWQGRVRPDIARAQALVFAGNHGVCAQGINPFPQEVTQLMVANFQAGGAAINQLCAVAGADLTVHAPGDLVPTGDFTAGPAMSPDRAGAAFEAGRRSVDPDADVLILGEMGIGNSTVAAALAASIFGGGGVDWAGPGTGADPEAVSRKAQVIDAGLARHARAAGDGHASLLAFGGDEQAAIAGAIVGARQARVPVLLDGFICTAAAAILHAEDPRLLNHCLAGHLSAEPGHARLLDAMGLTPVLSFDMRLGEGSGAALALMILRGAVACHTGMATFAEAGIGS